MYIWYIEKEKANWLIDKIRTLFNRIKIEKKNEKIFCILPNFKNTKRNIIKISKKLNNILYKYDIEDIVLSEELENLDMLKTILYSNNINILNGKKLFNFLAYDIVEKIINEQKEDMEAIEISIFVNDNSKVNIESIRDIARNIKLVNILTNNSNKFRKLEKELYEESGITLRITNNTKKGLLNSKFILNIDFPEELINKYIIPTDCTIINVRHNVKINSKSFRGRIINDCKIIIPQQYKIEGFNDNVVYESLIYYNNFLETKEKIAKEIELILP